MHTLRKTSFSSKSPWTASIWCSWREGVEKDARTIVPQACSSLAAILFAFQTPNVRMAVIRCFKTRGDKITFINFTTLLDILYFPAHTPSSKKRDFGHLIGARRAGSRGQNIRKVWASCQDLSSCYSERWPWPGEDVLAAGSNQCCHSSKVKQTATSTGNWAV